jgi:hypothetical protein
VDAGWRDIDVVQDGLDPLSQGPARSAVDLMDYVHIADGGGRGLGPRRKHRAGAGEFQSGAFAER